MSRQRFIDSSGQRLFTLVYTDFLESEVLTDPADKLVFICLKRYANAEGSCFPSIRTLCKITGYGRTRVKESLQSLKDKGILEIRERKRMDGSKTSNLYLLNDRPEIWNPTDAAVDEEELTAEEREVISRLIARGYKVSKKEESHAVTANLQQGSHSNLKARKNNNRQGESSQVYTVSFVQELYEYEILCIDNPHDIKMIDTVIDLVVDTLNSQNKTVLGEPIEIAKSKLLKLNRSEVWYSIVKFLNHKEKIRNPKSYMLRILLNAKTQMILDIENSVRAEE